MYRTQGKVPAFKINEIVKFKATINTGNVVFHLYFL